MRKLTTTFCIVGVVGALGACAGKHKSEAKELSPEEQAMNQRQSSAQTAEKSAQGFESSKKDYLTKSQDDLNNLEAKIAAFKAQAPADPNQRQSHEDTVKTLEQDLAQARAKLKDVQDATVDHWSDAQRNFEQAILTANAAYDASSRMAH